MNPGQIIFDGSMFLAVAIAIAAGLVSFLSPCVLPLVPGYLGVLSGMAPGESRVAVPAGGGGAGAAAGAGSNVGATLATATGVGRGRLIAGVLLFIGGFTVVFVTIFVLGGTVGLFFLEYSDIITRVMGAIVIALGLVF